MGVCECVIMHIFLWEQRRGSQFVFACRVNQCTISRRRVAFGLWEKSKKAWNTRVHECTLISARASAFVRGITCVRSGVASLTNILGPEYY